MIVKKDALNILPTDRLFMDSPDTGRPDCLCSRCNVKIQEDETAIRVFVNKGKDGEYRFCEFCMSGERYFFCDAYGEMRYKCSKQCWDCKVANE